MLFSGILKQVEEQQNAKRKFKRLTGILKYAAVAILFFAVGALFFIGRIILIPSFIHRNWLNHIPGMNAKLIRPDGEAILLEEQKIGY